MNAPPPQIRRIVARVLAALMGLVFAVAIAEAGLRIWSTWVAQSDRMDPGLIQRDPILGWRLTPSWSGQHSHHDFSARYSIGPDGFRHDPHALPPTNGWIAVVGDSFTFGLGVQDDQTFCSLLNQQSTRPFANFGIPGFSTDQEILLVEREILRMKPAEILLVVYLGNDLFDNLRPIPLQVGAPKPRFELNETNLVFRAPGGPDSSTDSTSGDAAVDILGPEANRSWRSRLSRQSAAFRFLESRLPVDDLAPRLPERLKGSLDLFGALLARMNDGCRQDGVRLRLVLVGSATLIHVPQSPTGQYQEFLRHRLTAMAQALEVSVIDTTPHLVANHRANGTRVLLYHPHEGHLTPSGHQRIADAIAVGLNESIPNWAPPPRSAPTTGVGRD
jgi:hypothetical protein